MSGGYCVGIALGRDTKSITARPSDWAGGFNFWAPFPVAIFLMALRTVAILTNWSSDEQRRRGGEGV